MRRVAGVAQGRRAIGVAAAFAALVLSLAACGGNGYETVKVADLANATATATANANANATAPNLVVLDVREPYEFAEGHVPGAILLPLSSLEQRIDEVPEGDPIYVICRSGNRSQQASEILVENGVKNVVNVDGGMIAWQAAGYPVERP